MSFRTRLFLAASLASLLTGCKVYDPLYCDEDRRCTDPDRPFCDLNGEYPDSEGVGRTCIPDPTTGADAGPGSNDGGGAGIDGGASQDASGMRRVVQLATSGTHTCALLSDGALRCWGEHQALGYATEDDVGDNEHPYQAGDVPTGGRIKQMALGLSFSCALYEAGNVRCWGVNSFGQLGYGHQEPLHGPGETPNLLADVELNGLATEIAAGVAHACALLESGDVRCWGKNSSYELASGDTEAIGDDEVPGSRSPVQIGADVLSLRAGYMHNCVVVEGDFVRCWGTALQGPIGYGDQLIIGDDETPAAAGNVTIGGSALQVAPATDHTCALLSGGRVRCWGRGVLDSVLGYQETEDIGDDETPASAGDIELGGNAVEIASMHYARCARLAGGAVRCWGKGSDASLPLGYGNVESIGDNEAPASAGDVELGEPAAQLSRGLGGHVCALLESGAVRCWGSGGPELGLGFVEAVGDDETPIDVDPVRVLE